MSDEWGRHESGPFCRHWFDPADCEAICVNCGHRCGNHADYYCGEESCDCDEWKAENDVY